MKTLIILLLCLLPFLGHGQADTTEVRTITWIAVFPADSTLHVDYQYTITVGGELFTKKHTRIFDFKDPECELDPANYAFLVARLRHVIFGEPDPNTP